MKDSWERKNDQNKVEVYVLVNIWLRKFSVLPWNHGFRRKKYKLKK